MLARYARQEMSRMWSPEHKYEVWRQIELLALEAQAELGTVPISAVHEVRSGSDFEIDDRFVARVAEIEEQVQHDVIAFVTAYAERVGPAGRYIHHGLTSYDVVDTALARLMVDAMDVILASLELLMEAVKNEAQRHRGTVMVGRTHGIHAEPITFGFKLAGWYTELGRHRVRLVAARESMAVGKLSGAVGTFGHLDPAVEQMVCERMGLTPAPVSTQVLGRDRHAEYLGALAVLAAGLDRFATEVRGLQRSEVREVEEPFSSGQKGSSAMPHKRNPVICERISGLSRIVKKNAGVALDNVTLWHERDISNSAPERLVIPESTTLVDYMLAMMTRVVTGWRVSPERMRRNLDAGGGVVFSQRVLLALVESGLAREEAYRVVQECALESLDGERGFRELVSERPEVTERLGPERLADCFDHRPAISRVDSILNRAGIPGRWGGRPEVSEEIRKTELLYRGKAKAVYLTTDPEMVIVDFTDDATAFDGKKRGTIGEKGIVNCAVSRLCFEYLERAGIATHLVGQLGERELLTRRVDIIPLEVVMRNVTAGSIAKRLGLSEGVVLARPVAELYLKDDSLGDPLITVDHALVLEAATEDEIGILVQAARKINDLLRPWFADVGLVLVDFKLEFGRVPSSPGRILLADEISPDTCRFWDSGSGEKLDKDRFRRDLGGVEEAYREVWRRLHDRESGRGAK